LRFSSAKRLDPILHLGGPGRLDIVYRLTVETLDESESQLCTLAGGEAQRGLQDATVAAHVFSLSHG